MNDKKTYEILKKNPTNTFKNRLIAILRNIKKETNIHQTLYHQLYPTSDQAPRFYVLKIHKSKGCAKHLSKILNAVMGKNGLSIKNSQDFVNKIKDLEVLPGRKMVSIDVTALFFSIPMDFAFQAAKRKLSADSSWQRLTELTLNQVLSLLESCLSTTYFVCQGTFYKQ